MQSDAAKASQHQLEERILIAFEEQAAIAGPRQVSMAGLSGQLGISTRTLYRHFPGKSELVTALMHRWASEWFDFQKSGLEQGLSPRLRIERTALDWLRHTSRFSSCFWQELERDFPQAYAVYRDEYQGYLLRSRNNLLGSIRKGLRPELALNNLMLLIQACRDQRRCDQLNITREDALRDSIALWAQGALEQDKHAD